MTIILNLNESGKTHKVTVQDVRITYPVNKLIKCLPVGKAFGHAAKYHAYPECLEDLCWSLNGNILPDNQDQTTCKIPDLTSKSQNQQLCISKLVQALTIPIISTH